MRDEHRRDHDLRIRLASGDTVTSGYLLNRYAGLPVYDDVAALVLLATSLADVLDGVRTGFAPAARPGTVFGLMGQNIMDEVDAVLRLVGRKP